MLYCISQAYIQVVRVRVCVHFLYSVISRAGGTKRALSTECTFDQADFTDGISFIPSNLMEEISPYPEALSANI